jgi:hypothetical protein
MLALLSSVSPNNEVSPKWLAVATLGLYFVICSGCVAICWP